MAWQTDRIRRGIADRSHLTVMSMRGSVTRTLENRACADFKHRHAYRIDPTQTQEAQTKTNTKRENERVKGTAYRYLFSSEMQKKKPTPLTFSLFIA